MGSTAAAFPIPDFGGCNAESPRPGLRLQETCATIRARTSSRKLSKPMNSSWGVHPCRAQPQNIHAVPNRRISVHCPAAKNPGSAQLQNISAMPKRTIVLQCPTAERPCSAQQQTSLQYTQPQSIPAALLTSRVPSAQPQSILACRTHNTAVPAVPQSLAEVPNFGVSLERLTPEHNYEKPRPDTSHPTTPTQALGIYCCYLSRLAQCFRITLPMHAPFRCWKLLTMLANQKGVRVGMLAVYYFPYIASQLVDLTVLLLMVRCCSSCCKNYSPQFGTSRRVRT